MTPPRRSPAVARQTVDLAGWPDLVVIYLGMRVNTLAGLKTLMGFGPRIANAVGEAPDGLLLHESFLFSLRPPHVGMRQYWRDFDALERWARSEPHAAWWRSFVSDSGGTGFWHETYSMRAGIEAVYDDMPVPVGLMRIAPVVPARGTRFSARRRLRLPDVDATPAPVREDDTEGRPPTRTHISPRP